MNINKHKYVYTHIQRRDTHRKRTLRKESPCRRDIMCCFGDSGLTKQWHSLLTSNDSKRTAHTLTRINSDWRYSMTHTLWSPLGWGLLFQQKVTEGHSWLGVVSMWNSLSLVICQSFQLRPLACLILWKHESVQCVCVPNDECALYVWGRMNKFSYVIPCMCMDFSLKYKYTFFMRVHACVCVFLNYLCEEPFLDLESGDILAGPHYFKGSFEG